MNSNALFQAIANLKEEEAVKLTVGKLESGEEPHKVLEEARKAMELVGRRFSEGEYFIPDLIYSGEILKRVSELIKPQLKDAPEAKRIGRFVIGTVEGDIHDIGKNIVTFMFDINGFEVSDLGVDVKAEMFVKKIDEIKPEVVGLSSFLTVSFEAMKKTIEAIKSNEVINKPKIIIGGGLVDERVCQYVRADAYARDAVSGVSIARKWLEGD